MEPDTKTCPIWDVFSCLAGWIGVENLPNYQYTQMGMLILWWEGLGGGELAKHKKCASGACFFMSGGSGKAEHVKHAHLGVFYVFRVF